jgi:hypothetical protein
VFFIIFYSYNQNVLGVGTLSPSDRDLDRALEVPLNDCLIALNSRIRASSIAVSRRNFPLAFMCSDAKGLGSVEPLLNFLDLWDDFGTCFGYFFFSPEPPKFFLVPRAIIYIYTDIFIGDGIIPKSLKKYKVFLTNIIMRLLGIFLLYNLTACLSAIRLNNLLMYTHAPK